MQKVTPGPPPAGHPGVRPPGFRPPPPPQRREGEDPALVVRRKQTYAARLARQVAPPRLCFRSNAVFDDGLLAHSML